MPPDLRGLALDTTARSLGLEREPGQSTVFGALTDMAFDNGTATLVGFADGTTSLYTSGGGGVIGAGEHASVVSVTRHFLAAVADVLDHLEPEPDAAMPDAGRVRFHALTFDGRFAAEASEDELGGGHHPLSPAFFAAHGVIAAIREASPS
jgi:hypothetical protein